jgi:MFS family permease
VLLFGIVATGSITNFFPTVVKTLGFGNVESLLLTSPPYVLCFIVTCINSWHADRTGERFYHIVLPLVLAIAAFILAACTTAMAPRYVSMMLMVSCNIQTPSLSITTIASGVSPGVGVTSGAFGMLTATCHSSPVSMAATQRRSLGSRTRSLDLRQSGRRLSLSSTQ